MRVEGCHANQGVCTRDQPENMEQIIKGHNQKILKGKEPEKQEGGCNCRRNNRENCPIKDNCNQKNVIYHAKVTEGEEKKYIGSTVNFKKRWYMHKGSFRNASQKSQTTLASHIWDAGLNPNPKIEWSILTKATPYRKGGRQCDLCLTEKLFISKTFNNPQYLNQRTEIALKCRHKKKFLLSTTRVHFLRQNGIHINLAIGKDLINRMGPGT